MNKYISFFLIRLCNNAAQIKIIEPTPMPEPTPYEAIIIGGSYAGLAAAMTLGRSLRYVLVLDSGKPCNRQTPQHIILLPRTAKHRAKLPEKRKSKSWPNQW